MKKSPILILLALLLFTFLTSPVRAESYQATYDVYAGGIHALQARLNSAQTANAYDVSVSSETYGLLNKIVPWHAVLATKGTISKGQRLPSVSTSDTTTRSKHEVNTYRYTKGQFKDFTQVVDGVDETRKDLDPSVSAGTIDVMTSVFTLMDRVAAGKGCATESMIFDSERSYRLIFKDGAKETIKAGKYGSYSGEAISCTFEVKPEGGKWHKKPRGWMKIQNQAKKSGQMPTISFANVGSAAKPIFVPVRTIIKTDLGTFIAHLTSFKENSAK